MCIEHRTLVLGFSSQNQRELWFWGLKYHVKWVWPSLADSGLTAFLGQIYFGQISQRQTRQSLSGPVKKWQSWNYFVARLSQFEFSALQLTSLRWSVGDPLVIDLYPFHWNSNFTETAFGEYSSKFLSISLKGTFVKSRRQPFYCMEISHIFGREPIYYTETSQIFGECAQLTNQCFWGMWPAILMNVIFS